MKSEIKKEELIVEDCWEKTGDYLFSLYGQYFFADINDLMTCGQRYDEDSVDYGKWHHISTISLDDGMTKNARKKVEFHSLCSGFENATGIEL
jgi:hypothetical protein